MVKINAPWHSFEALNNVYTRGESLKGDCGLHAVTDFKGFAKKRWIRDAIRVLMYLCARQLILQREMVGTMSTIMSYPSPLVM